MSKRNADFARLERTCGIFLPDAVEFSKPEWAYDFDLAMDAQPSLITNSNAGIPAFLTQVVDPNILTILLAKNEMAEIFGEVRKGDWEDQTALFPVSEHTGEVSSYGDHNENGRTGANVNWPQRQSYLYQTIIEYGELELARAGRGRISWASELDKSAVTVLNKFQNYSYCFGIAGLANYGLLNEPNLSAPLTPATKAATGVTWFVNGSPNATANEVYNDIVALFAELVAQSAGLVNKKSKMTLAMSPGSEVALTFTNTYNVNVEDLLKKNFPNMTVKTAVQYGAVSTSNPQGIVGGNLLQLIADEVEGQETGFCAFNEKLRAHPIIRALSAFKQKKTQGTWGAVVRQPFAITQMLGV